MFTTNVNIKRYASTFRYLGLRLLPVHLNRCHVALRPAIKRGVAMKMSLNNKFVLVIFLSSLLVFTLSTLLEVSHGYNTGKRKIEDNLNLIRLSYLKPVSLSLYNYDEVQMQLLLEGIEMLDGIESAVIVESPIPQEEENRESSEFRFPLVHQHASGTALPLGHLVLKISYQNVMADIRELLVIRLIAVFLVLSLLSIVVALLFKRLLADPLGKIVEFVSQINVMKIGKRMPEKHFRQGEELGKVVSAFNGLLDRLERGMVDQEEAQQKLRSSEEVYRRLVENANDAIYIVQDGSMRFCNRVTETITGYSADELQAMPLLEIVHPDERDIVAQRIQARLSGIPTPSTNACRLLTKSGQVRYSEINSVVIQWDDQPAILSCLRDVTEQKNLKDQLQQTQKMDSIGRLAGGVAHDLNNLLTPILGYTELLSQGIVTADKQPEVIEKIASAGNMARDLVAQLLAFSRKQPLEQKQVNMNQILTDLKELLERTVRENIELTFRFSPDLPFIMGDIGQLKQIVINLTVNGSDAMPDGGKLIIETTPVEIDEEFVETLSTGQSGHFIQLSISDTGIGMDSTTCEKIFEPFFSTKGELGTGLGLSIVYGIVKQHGGFINVYSELGQGTRMNVYLPVAPEQNAEQESVNGKPGDYSGTETILLAEDNEQVRDVSQAVLESLGYNVLLADGGKQAIAIYKDHPEPIDLLLTDVIMPAMNGKELYEMLKQHSHNLRVIYMSGYTSDVITQHGVLSGGTQFIQKPFTSQTLAKKIREVLDA